MGTRTPSIDEPAPDADEATGAGSTSSVPTAPPTTRTGDLLRALLCALLVGACVASPGSAALLAPFVPALVAIRLLRRRAGASAFLAAATVSSLATALAAGADFGAAHAAVAALAALLLVPGLGHVHRRAALRDPAEAGGSSAWPEPRLGSGLSLAVAGWTVALAVLAVVALPFAEPPRQLAEAGVAEAYAPYTRECRDGGAFATRDSFCDEIQAQRESVLEAVRQRGPELLAAAFAALALGAAATAHLVVTSRARRVRDTIRPAWRLRELEVHWAAAYLVAAGLAAWLLAGGDGAVLVGVRAVGVALGTLGAALLVLQGLGLFAWLLSRGRSPRWYRAFLIVVTLFVLPVVATLLFALGVLDMALRPRRRGADSDTLPRRGSGS